MAAVFSHFDSGPKGGYSGPAPRAAVHEAVASTAAQVEGSVGLSPSPGQSDGSVGLSSSPGQYEAEALPTATKEIAPRRARALRIREMRVMRRVIGLASAPTRRGVRFVTRTTGLGPAFVWTPPARALGTRPAFRASLLAFTLVGPLLEDRVDSVPKLLVGRPSRLCERANEAAKHPSRLLTLLRRQADRNEQIFRRRHGGRGHDGG
jgi:hypothetical protein